jgi:DNA-binding LacI/PurR family transcriptional regulator
MAVTLSDVAQRAGVSISAASRVLTNAPSTRVGQATRERIMRLRTTSAIVRISRAGR